MDLTDSRTRHTQWHYRQAPQVGRLPRRSTAARSVYRLWAMSWSRRHLRRIPRNRDRHRGRRRQAIWGNLRHRHRAGATTSNRRPSPTPPPPTAIHLARAGAGTGRAGTRRHQTIAGNRRGVGNPASTAVNQKHRAGRRYTQQAPHHTLARRKRRSSHGPAQARFGRTRAGRATLTTSGLGKAYRPRHHRDKAIWRLISARAHGT